MKKVLAIYYTQSGQLEEIVTNFTGPFTAAGMLVDKVRIRPVKDFNFPWTGKRFFSAMPESVLCTPLELEHFELKEESYDLIVFAYQPWFLSPSIPATSALAHPQIRKHLKHTPVITLIGSRNMWISAQEKVKNMLREAGANLVGNVALADRNSNLISAVTIVHWMFSGKKDKYLGLFPKPGIADDDIIGVNKFGLLASNALHQNNLSTLQEQLVAAKAVEVQPDLMFIESKGSRIFSIWANLISKRKNRGPWLVAFKYYLLIALFLLSPVVLAINGLLFRPFMKKQIKRKQDYYLGLKM